MSAIFRKILFSINLLFIIFGIFVLALSLQSNFKELELTINNLSDSLVVDLSQSLPISKFEVLNELNSTVHEMARLLTLAGAGIRGILMISVSIILINTIYVFRLNRLLIT